MPASQQLAAVYWELGVGILFIVMIYMVVRTGWFRKGGNDLLPPGDTPPEAIEPVAVFPDEFAEGQGRVPFVLKLFIVGFIIWAIGYIVLFTRAMQGAYGDVARYLSGS